MVQATWRNRLPGSFLIPAEYPRFHSSSSALPLTFWTGLKGIGLESERIRISISPCSPHLSTKFGVSADGPWGPKVTQKLVTLNDFPEYVKQMTMIFSIFHRRI